MPKIVKFPARLSISFNKEGGVVTVSDVEAKYNLELSEYPEIRLERQSTQITLTSQQEQQITTFCKDVILPQILGGG